MSSLGSLSCIWDLQAYGTMFFLGKKQRQICPWDCLLLGVCFKEISGMLFTSLVPALGLFRIPVLCDVYFSKDFVLTSSSYSIESCSFASAQNIFLSEYFKTYDKSPFNQ